MAWSGKKSSLLITGIEEIGFEIGEGSYGKVFKLQYCGATCAAKENLKVFLPTIVMNLRNYAKISCGYATLIWCSSLVFVTNRMHTKKCHSLLWS